MNNLVNFVDSDSPGSTNPSDTSLFDTRSIIEQNEHLYDSYEAISIAAKESENLIILENVRKRQIPIPIPEEHHKTKHLILCTSNENLQFIDSECQQEKNPAKNSHNDRFITIMPKNLQSNLSLHSQKAQRRKYFFDEIFITNLQNVARKILKLQYTVVRTTSTQQDKSLP